MDGVTPRQGRESSSRTHHRPVQRTSAQRPKTVSEKDRNPGQRYWLVRSLGKVAAKKRLTLWTNFRSSEFAKWPDKSIWHRVYATTTLVLFVISTLAGIVQPMLDATGYKISPASRAIIPQPSAHLAEMLTFDAKESTYMYNQGYSPSKAAAADAKKDGNGDPRFSAKFAKDPSKGVTVTDTVSNVDFTLKPKFNLGSGKKDQNQVVYPLNKTNGFLVYTAQIASVKEDIVLQSVGKDKMTFDYTLDLGSGLEAKLEKDGSVGIYGSSLPLYGNVATGSDKDVQLLQKAKENAPKTKFLFGIPAPVVKEAGERKSSVSASFELKGNILRVTAGNLKKASYPLTIDPSVYIQSAAQLMKGNNETNVEFDVATEQFKKGATTGARINEWTETGAMNDAVYDESVVAAGGYVYRAGGRSGRVMPWVASQMKSSISTAATTFTMNMPTVRPVGDLYMAIIARDGTGAVTAPGGWTNLVNTREHLVYWRTGGASEPASYNWTIATGVQWSGVIIRIKDAASSPTFTTTSQNSASAVNPVYPAVTPTSQGALVLRSASWNDDTTPDHGYAPQTTPPTTDHDEIATGTSGAAAGVTFAVSRLDIPPTSTVPAALATTPTGAGVSDTYGSSSIAVYGATATPAYNQTLQWAHFNSTTGGIDSPAPGSDAVACAGWCTNSAYNLPTGGTAVLGAGNVGAAMVAYNGYLYYMGGTDGTNIKSTIYVAKLGANGEPSLWHPSDPIQANWVYWYKDAGISAAQARQYMSAYAYNGKMYVLGGDTDAASNTTGAISTVQVADILPNGTLGTWSSGQTLTGGNRYGASVQSYNGYLYILGGNTGSAMLNLVQYSKLNSDGTMNTWQTAAVDGADTFATARFSLGGTMSGIWGGYIYLAGGCSAVNASGYCTTIASDVQLASINSDGSLDTWNTMANLRNARFGSSFIAWQDNLYRFGGCSKQDASNGDCYATHPDIQYGNINRDGDASTVRISTAYTSGTCVDPDPYNCNLPAGGTGSGQGGQALSAAVILNGYLYVIGGCTTNACTTMSSNTSYSAIDSNGRLKSPPSCSGTKSGAWCVDSTNTVNAGGGLGATAVTVFNGTIYVVGGQNGSAAVGNIQRNTVNADGSFAGAWSTAQTLASVGAQSVSYTYVYARANPGSAGSNPGNLYIFGGCGTPAGGAGCGTDSAIDSVYKCNIATAGTINTCTKTGQQQIGTPTGGTAAGLAIHAGAVYANYIYLAGGVGIGVGSLDLKTIRYAKFDNSNNVVAVSGSAWVESPNQTTVGRRRGAAFGYNGYLYVVGGYDSNSVATLKDIQFAKINVSDGSIGAFQTSGVTINQRWGLALVVSNSYAYVIGGCKLGTSPACDAGGLDDTVQTFQVYNNDSGAPGGYSAGANLYTTDRIGAGAAVLNGYMYIAGGCITNTDCGTTTASVQKALIDANGALGAWTSTNVTALTTALAYGQLEVAGGGLYYIGGQTSAGTVQSTVLYATMSTNGEISAWTAASGGIGDTAGQVAQARTKFSSAVWNNRIYVTGGYDGTARSTHVYISPQLNSGGNIAADSWTGGSGSGFNVARESQVAITYANNIYILGGYDGTNYLSDVQFAQISSTGTLGSWSYTTSLPTQLRQADGFASNGYMYIFGGRSSTNDCTKRTLIAPVSANTTIASGNNPTGIGEWYQTNRNFDGGRYGVSAVNYLGKAYVLGGGCQGIVQQDDFDSALDGSQWTSTTGMTVGTTCQSTSTSNVLYMTTGGATNSAVTKNVDVSSGGTVYFKMFSPSADGGGCYTREQDFVLLGTSNPDDIEFQWAVSPYTVWTSIASYAWNTSLEPMKSLSATIPAGAQSAATRFRWIMPLGEATDSFSLEDVSIIATGNTTISYPSDRVAQTALLSQPQVATYSRLVDAGNDAFPTKWLMNGLDNSIGARWQMRYRSMNDTTNTASPCGGSVMTGFGQETNYGDVTLGTPGAYIMKNGAGTNIGCGRYFFMTVSIDASQTYGYPDDIARGPTLDNLTLFFNSNPGKRLIHGKTFIEGTQQPLDTQP